MKSFGLHLEDKKAVGPEPIRVIYVAEHHQNLLEIK